MTEREHCRAAALNTVRALNISRSVSESHLEGITAVIADYMFNVRAAARRAALEDAAGVCDEAEKRERASLQHLGSHSPYLAGRIKQAGKDAEAIRALIAKERP